MPPFVLLIIYTHPKIIGSIVACVAFSQIIIEMNMFFFTFFSLPPDILLLTIFQADMG